MERRFNLIDEPWLPIVDVGRVSLRQVFSEPSYRALGGNPVQKRAGVKSFMRLTQNLKLYMRQQVSSFLGCFAEVRLRGLGAT